MLSIAIATDIDNSNKQIEPTVSIDAEISNLSRATKIIPISPTNRVIEPTAFNAFLNKSLVFLIVSSALISSVNTPIIPVTAAVARTNC